jgi:hypothetical protein
VQILELLTIAGTIVCGLLTLGSLGIAFYTRKIDRRFRTGFKNNEPPMPFADRLKALVVGCGAAFATMLCYNLMQLISKQEQSTTSAVVQRYGEPSVSTRQPLPSALPLNPGKPKSKEASAQASISHPMRNPFIREDAVWIQHRLAELGYSTRDPLGIWGRDSAEALRTFKAINGLDPTDTWDLAVENDLMGIDTIPAAKSFLGGWSPSRDQCRDSAGAVPLVISIRSAEAESGYCQFLALKRAESAWHIDATCAVAEKSWNSSITLSLEGDALTWSSEKGTAVYYRCK